jgi:hypothetical protein
MQMHADAHEHEPGKKVFLTLDFHECLLDGILDIAIVLARRGRRDVDSTYIR